MKHFCREIKLQLKVCEACGALWVRRPEQSVYCPPCASWLADFPAPRRIAPRARRRRHTVLAFRAGRAPFRPIAGGAR